MGSVNRGEYESKPEDLLRYNLPEGFTKRDSIPGLIRPDLEAALPTLKPEFFKNPRLANLPQPADYYLRREPVFAHYYYLDKDGQPKFRYRSNLSYHDHCSQFPVFAAGEELTGGDSHLLALCLGINSGNTALGKALYLSTSRLICNHLASSRPPTLDSLEAFYDVYFRGKRYGVDSMGTDVISDNYSAYLMVTNHNRPELFRGVNLNLDDKGSPQITPLSICDQLKSHGETWFANWQNKAQFILGKINQGQPLTVADAKWIEVFSYMYDIPRLLEFQIAQAQEAQKDQSKPEKLALLTRLNTKLAKMEPKDRLSALPGQINQLIEVINGRKTEFTTDPSNRREANQLLEVLYPGIVDPVFAIIKSQMSQGLGSMDWVRSTDYGYEYLVFHTDVLKQAGLNLHFSIRLNIPRSDGFQLTSAFGYTPRGDQKRTVKFRDIKDSSNSFYGGMDIEISKYWEKTDQGHCTITVFNPPIPV